MPEPFPPNNTPNESNSSLPPVGTPSRVETYETPDGSCVTYEYDHLGRLLSRTEPLPGEGPHCAVFRYDGAGNQ